MFPFAVVVGKGESCSMLQGRQDSDFDYLQFFIDLKEHIEQTLEDLTNQTKGFPRDLYPHINVFAQQEITPLERLVRVRRSRLRNTPENRQEINGLESLLDQLTMMKRNASRQIQPPPIKPTTRPPRRSTTSAAERPTRSTRPPRSTKPPKTSPTMAIATPMQAHTTEADLEPE